MTEQSKSGRGRIAEELAALGLIVVAMGLYEWDVVDIAQPSQNLMVMRPVLVAGWVLVAVVLWLFVLRPLLRPPARGADATSASDDAAVDAQTAPGKPLRSMLGIVATLALYVAAFPFVPFLVSTTAFLAASLVVLGSRSPLSIVLVSVGTALTLYLAGVRVLDITLP